MTRSTVILLLAVLFGAILLSSLLQSCSAPQVCKHCWVAGK